MILLGLSAETLVGDMSASPAAPFQALPVGGATERLRGKRKDCCPTISLQLWEHHSWCVCGAVPGLLLQCGDALSQATFSGEITVFRSPPLAGALSPSPLLWGSALSQVTFSVGSLQVSPGLGAGEGALS